MIKWEEPGSILETVIDDVLRGHIAIVELLVSHFIEVEIK